jgi:hypothetical protein
MIAATLSVFAFAVECACEKVSLKQAKQSEKCKVLPTCRERDTGQGDDNATTQHEQSNSSKPTGNIE